jgi:hypothetical protein
MLTPKNRTRSISPKRALVCAAAISAFGAFGCATDDADLEGEQAEEQDTLELAAPIDQQATRPDPNKPFFAEVTANGTGCPRGTWETAISPDGETFTTTFSAYEVEVEDGKRTSFKDCNLTIKLRSPSGISYAVSDFFYQGYAFLENGVRGFQTANYYFQGNPIPSVDKEKRTDLTGPVDRSYLFQDTVRTADVVWSPCGLDRNLQVVTRLGLQKSQNKGAGYINLSAVDGKVDGKVVLKLAWRKCDSGSNNNSGSNSGNDNDNGGRNNGGRNNGGRNGGGIIRR